MRKPTFEDVRPDLKKYYKPELNDGKLMSEFSRCSNKRIMLSCDNCSTKREVRIASYTTSDEALDTKFKCIYCHSVGYLHPELIKEWSIKNECSPFEVLSKVREKVWWCCERGYEWKDRVCHRTSNGSKCPICNSKYSKGEKIIMDWLEKENIKYIPQYFVNGRYYDIYIPELKLYTEIQGAQHYEPNPLFTTYSFDKQLEVDKQKKQYAEEHGYYLCVDYREHKPELALTRFKKQFDRFINEGIKSH